MKWVHLLIRDVLVPDAKFEAAWATVGLELRECLQRVGSILVHCRGGLGRTGTIAARLLVELAWMRTMPLSRSRTAMALCAIRLKYLTRAALRCNIPLGPSSRFSVRAG